jgi:heat shock protein HtpX
MWELIRENNLKSWILFILMGAALIVMGYAIGSVWFGPEGALYGVFISCMVWLIMSLVSFTSGDTLVLKMSGAKEVTPDIHPQLFNIVEEMKIAANLPVMPRIYIIDVAYPNAFATGISANKSSIAVTAGLLTMLNRDELQGVIAHEMSHITNRDVLFVTFAGVMLGSIALLSEVFFRSMFYSSRGSSRRYRSGGGSGQGGAILAVIAIVFAILAPILTRLLYFALSRRREYLADATAVRLTRYPEGLASALEKISSNMGHEEGRPNKVNSAYVYSEPAAFQRNG